MKFHPIILSLAPMVLFLAVLLLVLHISASVTNAARIPYALGGVVFWLVLLMPTWAPLLVMDKEARRRAGVRPFLVLIPSLWYCCLFVLPEATLGFSWTTHIILQRVIPIIGMLIVCPVLAMCARGWWRILLVPLAIAIVAGTITLEITAWSTGL